MKAVAINCTLKVDQDEPSSTDLMIGIVARELAKQGVEVAEVVRVSSLNILPGVTSDEGLGDDWPDLRRRILDADILIFGTPI